jgi:AraC-like DNA-binding protein
MTGLTVGAGFARGLFDLAIAKGADPQILAARAGIDPAALQDQDGRIPLARYVALMRAAQTLCQDPALALHYGEAADLSEFSIVGLICNAAETMGDALVQLNRFGRLVVEIGGAAPGARFQHQRINGQVWLVDTREDPNDFPELTESTFARMVARTRQFGDTPFVKAVHVTHAKPAHAAEYDRIFGAPTTFSAPRNALQIDETWIQHRVAIAPRYVFGILSEHAEALLASLERAKTLRGRIEALLLPILHTGDANIATIASRLGSSRQTLYRQLKADGTSFEKLLDELRHTLALHYLAGKRVSVNETAYLVGFSEPAAFSRAFKRWTGISPKQARQPPHPGQPHAHP